MQQETGSFIVCLAEIRYRDTAFSRFNKINKGKATHRVTEINKRHKAAEKMRSEGNTPLLLDDKTWLVISQTTTNKKYTVQYIAKCTTCELRCSKCNTCIHMYTCSCLDSVTHTTVCKHIHLIHLLEGERYNSMGDGGTTQISVLPNKRCNNALASNEYFSHILRNKLTSTTIQSAKDQATLKLHHIQAQISQCDNIQALKSVIHHLNCAIGTVNAMTKHPIQTLSVSKHISPNTKMDPQKRYHSTKKVRRQTIKTVNKCI